MTYLRDHRGVLKLIHCHFILADVVHKFNSSVPRPDEDVRVTILRASLATRLFLPWMLGNSRWPHGAGIGTELPLLVPQVDADGNDLAGIRMPDVSVPLGTCTG